MIEVLKKIYSKRRNAYFIHDEEKWVYLAEDEGFLYAYRVADGTFYQLDDLLFDIRKSYGSYEEMIKEIIEESLK